jgi:hypothetical protein
MPAWTFDVSMPGWNELCIGFDLVASKVSSSVNGLIGSAVVVNGVSAAMKSLLTTSKITMTSELFSEFNFYSLPISKIVSGSSGNLLSWNINHWVWDKMAMTTTVSKTEIYSPGGPRYLAIQAALNFHDAVSIFSRFLHRHSLE